MTWSLVKCSESLEQGHLTMSGDVFGCHNWGVTGGVPADIYWAEVSDAKEHSTVHGTAPEQRTTLVPCS